MSVMMLLVILLTIHWSPSSAHKRSDINVILRVCAPGVGNCFTNQSFTGEEYYRSALKLMSGGIFQLMIENLDDVIKGSDISAECSASLRATKQGIFAGRHDDFMMLDASAKMPNSLLDSTVTSLGDFDECLAIQTNGHIGKYCVVDLFPLRPEEHVWRPNILHFGKYSFFNGTSYFFGLCFPSTCSENEVRSLTRETVKNHPFSVNGDVSCVTKEDISIINRLLSLSKEQVISILVIGSFVAAVVVASLLDSLRFLDIVGIDIRDYTNMLMLSETLKKRVSDFIDTFSGFKTLTELVEDKTKSNHLAFVDWIKLAIVLAGVFAHCLSCLETPLGFFMIDKHNMLSYVINNPFTQFFFNDGGLGWVTFLSGLSTFLLLQPLITENRLSFKMAIFDRWIRFAPAVMIITCFDFIWPLVLNGPFHSRVSSWISWKCSKNWWWNLSMISVFLPALEICAPHTYFTSIDMMLFLLGLIAVTLLVKYPNLGIFFSSGMVTLGLSLMIHYCAVYEIPPAVIMDHIRAQKVVDFLDTIQMSLYSYFHNYFLGLLTAFFLKRGFTLTINSFKDHILWFSLIGLSLALAEVSPALHNTFDVVPQELVPYYLVFNRLCFSAAVTVVVIYGASVADPSPFRPKEKRETVNPVDEGIETIRKFLPTTQEVVDDTDGLSRIKDLLTGIKDVFGSRFVTAISRLSFSIFICNYWFIRNDFFYSRTPFETNFYPLTKRLISYHFFILLFAVIFHVLFVSPIEKLRKRFNYKITK